MRNHRPGSKQAAKIPPPPGRDAGYDAILEYFQMYTTEELEEAGYLKEVSEREIRGIVASATFSHLREHGLRIQLSKKDCERISRLAAFLDESVDTLAGKWIKERLSQEMGKRRAKMRAAEPARVGL